MPHWLESTDASLFISRRRMPSRKLYRPLGEWALDSGGFSELSLYGEWRTSPEAYAEEVRRWSRMPGVLWAAAQDWMCEPFICEKTGLTVAEHQRRTVGNYLRLLELAPEIAWTPVVQGFRPGEYLECVRLYERNGVDLRSVPTVGLGSVCRRQQTGGVDSVCRELHRDGIRLHGFGVKLSGLPTLRAWLHSADSMAWCKRASKEPPMPECVREAETKGRACHKNCSNCLRFALDWRRQALKKIDRPDRVPQGTLFD